MNWHARENCYSCKRGIVISTSHLLSEFRVSNILHAWTVNSVNILVKNPKHISAFTFSSKPNVYSSASQASSLAFVMRWIIRHSRLIIIANGWRSGLDGEVIAVMCFEFLINLFKEFTVHTCRASGKRWSAETEVRKRKYGNGNTEVKRKAA